MGGGPTLDTPSDQLFKKAAQLEPSTIASSLFTNVILFIATRSVIV